MDVVNSTVLFELGTANSGKAKQNPRSKLSHMQHRTQHGLMGLS